MIKRGKKLTVAILIGAMLSGTSISAFAADNDGWTEASKTEAAQNGAWEKWCEEWENIKNNPVQMSLTPGSDAGKLNFAWYSKDTEAKPKLKFGKSADMSDAQELEVTSEPAVAGYNSNKSTVSGLEENTTYYYSYEVNGEWTTPVEYKTQSTEKFSFVYVGDPQIGSSTENIATGEEEEQGQDKATRNDSFNWSNTINSALNKNPNLSFILSAGDQIQSRDKKNPSLTYDKNEIEYAGYLSAPALKSLPVATTIGNHDAPSGNYSYHFNNPNASEYGKTMAGGDYYYSYGDALFIMLNTNNYNIAEHEALIKEAIEKNPEAKWRIVTLHQDIYGSGEHSNEPEIVELRYSLVPIFEENNIDVVLTGHDHTYTRSLILKGGVKDESKMISDDEYETYFEEDLAGNTEALDSKYFDYIESIQDKNSVVDVTYEEGAAVDPDGILYMTANSSSGSKFYDLVSRQQSYVAARWQEDVPTYSIIDIDEVSFTINTYRTDNGEKIDNTYSIVKSVDKSNLTELIAEAEKTITSENNYTEESLNNLKSAIASAKEIEKKSAATTEEVGQSYGELTQAMSSLEEKEPAKTENEENKDNTNEEENNNTNSNTNSDSNKNTSSNNNNSQKGNSAKTGDNTNIYPIVGVSVVSLIVLGSVYYVALRKKKRAK